MTPQQIQQLAEKIVLLMKHYPINEIGDFDTDKATVLVSDIITAALQSATPIQGSKELKDITDEDAIEVAKILYEGVTANDTNIVQLGRNVIYKFTADTLFNHKASGIVKVIRYLEKQGYKL